MNLDDYPEIPEAFKTRSSCPSGREENFIRRADVLGLRT
jgi:hypothetical protein